MLGMSTWHLEIWSCLKGQERLFTKGKGNFLFSPCVKISFWSCLFSILSSSYLSALSLNWQGVIASRRRNCKMTYNLKFWTLKIMFMEPYVFNFKSIARLHGFESSWTFWKACFKSYNFHVLSFFQIKMELCEKMAWSLEKIQNFNT